MHGYYLALLAPPICALFGGGLIHRWQSYARKAATWWLLPAAVLAGSLWAAYLGSAYTHFLPLLPWIVGALGLVAALLLLLRRPTRNPEPVVAHARGTQPIARLALSVAAALGVVALLASPAAWALSALSPAYASTSGAPMAGPAGTLYVPVVRDHQALPAQYTLTIPVGRDRKLLAYLKEHQGTEQYLAAANGAAVAEPFLRAGSGDFLVLGGFTGLTPNVTAQQFAALVAQDRVRYLLTLSGSRQGAAAAWAAKHCLRVAPGYYRERTDAMVQLYDCRPVD
jgi:hypothetical protein